MIQDANFNFVIDPGETLATSGGELTPGGPAKFSVSLPAAGIYYVHVASPTVDVNYSLALGFSNTVGSFVLTPRNAAVNPGEHVSLGLQWTVPDGSWHGLRDVELRVRDAFGTLAPVKFNEANNTLSLFNPDRGEFGPAKLIGSDAALANQYVTIFLRTSSITSAGPNSPTVTLTLDMVFRSWPRAGISSWRQPPAMTLGAFRTLPSAALWTWRPNQDWRAEGIGRNLIPTV